MSDNWKKWLPFKREDKPATQGRETGAAHPMTRLHQEMDRLFHRFMEPGAWPGFDREGWFGDFSSSVFSPTIDLADEKSHLKVTAELPGLDKDDFQLEVKDDALVLRGEKKSEETSEEEGFYRTERSYGSFSRVIPLPEEVDAGAAEADFKKGVLTVRLPKVKGEKKSRRIEVSSS